MSLHSRIDLWVLFYQHQKTKQKNIQNTYFHLINSLIIALCNNHLDIICRESRQVLCDKSQLPCVRAFREDFPANRVLVSCFGVIQHVKNVFP